jgi:hypothetical protein
MRRTWPLALTSLLTLATQVAAITFTDVPATSPHYQAIMDLTNKGVISGYPDGTYKINNPINRAAALKILYVAAGKTGDPTKKNCFEKEKFDDWFAPYACDAVAKGYVSGYGNGTFGANDPVTGAQFLKMAANVFELKVPGSSDVMLLSAYPNVNSNDWFGAYITLAIQAGMLPLAGQSPSQFYPNDPITRGQAASFAHRTWVAKDSGQWSIASNPTPPPPPPAQNSSSSPLTGSVSSTGRRQPSSSAAKPQAEIRKVTVPFEDKWTFSGKNTITYSFSLKGAAVVDIQTLLDPGMQGDVTCRLYRIQSDGFSLEYYLGYQEKGNCALFTALTAGDYQLQLQPTTGGVTYSVKAALSSGDGNDGLSQAKKLQANMVKADLLDNNKKDLEDWFVFTIDKASELGTPMTLKVASKTHVTCLIYPWSDVDIYGFAGPKCNEQYSYPKGTYYVRIGHGAQRALKQTYSVELR